MLFCHPTPPRPHRLHCRRGLPITTAHKAFLGRYPRASAVKIVMSGPLVSDDGANDDRQPVPDRSPPAVPRSRLFNRRRSVLAAAGRLGEGHDHGVLAAAKADGIRLTDKVDRTRADPIRFASRRPRKNPSAWEHWGVSRKNGLVRPMTPL